MKRLLSLVLISLLMVSLIPGTALAAGKISVVQETFMVLPYIGYHAGYVYAEVKNTGDKAVEFAGGLLELYDADGNSIESTDYIYFYPKVLAPDEVGYLYAYQGVEEATDKSFIADYLLTVTSKGAKDTEKVAFITSNARYEKVDLGYWGYHYAITDVMNASDKTFYDYDVVYALKDADGKLLYVDNCNPSYVGLKPGSIVEVRVSVSSDVATYWEENKIVPASVEAASFIIID